MVIVRFMAEKIAQKIGGVRRDVSSADFLAEEILRHSAKRVLTSLLRKTDNFKIRVEGIEVRD